MVVLALPDDPLRPRPLYARGLSLSATREAMRNNPAAGVAMSDARRCLVCRGMDDLYGTVCQSCRTLYRVAVGYPEHCRSCGTRLRRPAKLCGLCALDTPTVIPLEARQEATP